MENFSTPAKGIVGSISGPMNRSKTSLRAGNQVDENLTPPNEAVDQVERWNYPRRNTFKVLSACWGFIIMGANDAVIGVSLHTQVRIQKY
jgi:hypothetical protein